VGQNVHSVGGGSRNLVSFRLIKQVPQLFPFVTRSENKNTTAKLTALLYKIIFYLRLEKVYNNKCIGKF
uniref:Uncharacterized protein n=1 Tax=Anopheles quadriannulatus TaxID=34691 RepID=A0A182XSE3_ANOQN